MIGARVIKTSLAVTLSILIARSFELHTPQFAGIIAVLSVQPSLYRSFRHGLQHTASAAMGAVAGAYCLAELGNSFLVMGLVTFGLMAVHVWIKWKNSLLVSVVVAINTLGTTSMYLGESATNQLALVLIGTGAGMFINACYKPRHDKREEQFLKQSEEMLRSLLYFIYIDLVRGSITDYPSMRKQIDEVKRYIENGKEVSAMIGEDRRYHRLPKANRLILFTTFESMAERIRDISKALQKADVLHLERTFMQKVLLLLIRLQEKAQGERLVHFAWVESIIERRRQALWSEQDRSAGFAQKLALYNTYGFLLEYARHTAFLQEQYLAAASPKKRFALAQEAMEPTKLIRVQSE
ncbi:MAG: FUSC family protein [Clostridia bacterium]